MKNLKIIKNRKILKKSIKFLKFKYEILEEDERFVKVRYTNYKEISYESLVIKLIRKRYSLDQELAILRQRDVKPEEFLDYNDYVEECKTTAKEFVNEREANRLPKPPKEEETENEQWPETLE